ncbi:MAG: hypothetical protein AMXMBFR83_22580 [Phycisphaerae bacterium]
MRITVALLLSGLTACLAALAADSDSSDGAPRRQPATASEPLRAATRPAENVRRPSATRPRRPLVGPLRRNAEAVVPPGPLGRREPPLGPAPARPPGPDEPLSPERIDQLMRFTRENFPQVHDRLRRLREADPVAFQHMIRRTAARLQNILDAQQRDPRLAERMIEEQRIQLALADLARRYHQARTDGERERIRRQIEARLGERFERQQGRARREIENLRRRLDERERNREEILRLELRRLLYGPPTDEQRPDANR